MQFKFNSSKPLLRFLRDIIIFIILVLLFFLISKKEFPQSIYLIIGVLFIIILPIIVLFMQYYYNDYRSIFIFEKSNNILSYKKGSINLNYTIDQIKFIELTGTAARLRKDGVNVFWQNDFFYYTFYFIDGRSVIITSVLLNWKLVNEANFKGIDFKKKVRFFPFL